MDGLSNCLSDKINKSTFWGVGKDMSDLERLSPFDTSSGLDAS
jgi:hypothetical protein